jgi:hypothetical protein
MHKISSPSARLALLAIFGASFFFVSSAKAVLVTWEFNPQGLNQPVGSSSVTLSEYGVSIIASGYTVSNSGPDTPRGLYFKNEGPDELGLGVVGTAHHELEGIGGAPAQYIQLDLSAILARGGVTNGKLQVGSVQGDSNDTFTIYGSNTAGILGKQIAGVFDSSSDQVFVSIPNFGAFKYISIGALSGDVLPMAFAANCTVIPEMGAILPLLGLFSAIGASRLLRRRAQA